MLWGTKKKVSEGAGLEKKCSDLFWPVFDLFTYNLTVFLAFQKTLGGTGREIFFGPKSDLSHAKPDIKAKKTIHFA